jgi:hypothetical protein
MPARAASGCGRYDLRKSIQHSWQGHSRLRGNPTAESWIPACERVTYLANIQCKADMGMSAYGSSRRPAAIFGKSCYDRANSEARSYSQSQIPQEE